MHTLRSCIHYEVRTVAFLGLYILLYEYPSIVTISYTSYHEVCSNIFSALSLLSRTCIHSNKHSTCCIKPKVLYQQLAIYQQLATGIKHNWSWMEQEVILNCTLKFLSTCHSKFNALLSPGNRIIPTTLLYTGCSKNC